MKSSRESSAVGIPVLQGREDVNGRRQRGFTLIELTIVGLIIAVIAVVAVPRVRDLVVDARVAGVARDVEVAALKIMQAREGMTPMFSHGGAMNAEFGAALRATGGTSLSMTSTVASGVSHPLGSGAGLAEVEVFGWTISSPGDVMVVTLHYLSPAACARLVHLLAPRAHAVNRTTRAWGDWAWLKPPGGQLDAAQVAVDCDTTGDRTLQFWYQ